jgi:putative NADPH-quinone reductase
MMNSFIGALQEKGGEFIGTSLTSVLREETRNCGVYIVVFPCYWRGCPTIL